MTEQFKLSIIHMQMVNRNRYGWHIFERRHRLIALGWRAVDGANNAVTILKK